MVKVTGSEKHSSLFNYGMNHDIIKFLLDTDLLYKKFYGRHCKKLVCLIPPVTSTVVEFYVDKARGLPTPP